MKKPALSIIGLALAASTLTACGGGISTDASVKEFCNGFESVGEDAGDPTAEDFDIEEAIEALQEDVEKLRETGAPEDISDEALEGFDISTQAVLDVDSDISKEEFQKLEFDEQFSKDEKKKSDAFEEYLSKTCDA